MKKNEVRVHIVEKFTTFASERNIVLNGTPQFCNVKIFASSKKTSQHMAVTATKQNPATKNNVEGYIVNVADKNLQFFTKKEANCCPLRDGQKIDGKNAIVSKDANGYAFRQ